MRQLLLIAAAIAALASPASAQFQNGQTSITTMPLGGGFQSYSGTVNGQSFSGTSVPLGGGFQSYNYNVGGQMHGGTSVPLGGGFQSYNGW